MKLLKRILLVLSVVTASFSVMAHIGGHQNGLFVGIVHYVFSLINTGPVILAVLMLFVLIYIIFGTLITAKLSICPDMKLETISGR